MDNNTIKLILSDGTEIKNLIMNGDNFVSKTELTDDIFSGRLSPVTIEYQGVKEIHPAMELLQVAKVKNEYWVVLRDIPEERIREMAMRSDLDYLAMMCDVDL